MGTLLSALSSAVTNNLLAKWQRARTTVVVTIQKDGGISGFRSVRARQVSIGECRDRNDFNDDVGLCKRGDPDHLGRRRVITAAMLWAMLLETLVQRHQPWRADQPGPCRRTATPTLGLELVFLHHPLILFARAFDPILIIASMRRELLNHFVEAVGRIAIRITAAKPDALPSLESMNHGLQASRMDMQHGDPSRSQVWHSRR